MSRFPAILLGLLAALPLGLAADPLDDAPARPVAVSRLVNADEVRRKLGLAAYPTPHPRIKDVRVAVLDSGFDGLDGKRPYLPKSAVVVEHYDREFVRRFNLGDPEFVRPFAPGNPHGRLLAQIAWAATGSSPDGPQFFLLNANGPTMFRRAIRFAIELKVDVILFGGTFEGAGNYDGRGPINAAVDEAVAAGVVWVNAAGNYGGSVYNGPVEVGPGGYLQFRGTPGLTALRLRNRFDENAVTVTLTWNDYHDAEDFGTEKDLDLVVEDAWGRVVGASRLRQVGPGKVAGEGETKNPRERLVLADLPAVPAGQEYRIRVLARTPDRFGPHDRLRVLVTSARDTPFRDPDTGRLVRPVEFLDASDGGEIFPPADHPGVLTVGDTSPASAVGPTADGRVKPDVVLADSTARFSNGDETAGSSNAAAYFAGVVAVMRASEPGLSTAHVREWVRALDAEAARVKATPAAPVAPPAAAPPPPLLSPNQQRALRYAGYALEEQRKRGERAPHVWMSTPGGTYLVRPGAPGDPPAAVARGVAPATTPAVAEAESRRLPHVPWEPPPPGVLRLLVRGAD